MWLKFKFGGFNKQNLCKKKLNIFKEDNESILITFLLPAGKLKLDNGSPEDGGRCTELQSKEDGGGRRESMSKVWSLAPEGEGTTQRFCRSLVPDEKSSEAAIFYAGGATQ
ncbi:hypothetical protein AXF42_Ash021091 [Apostasia shenzhenica]|uniref:Uncharacterized protein n=1 Tax=Apostasia shenzhenica TaxID=1088818 RepID=A0A2I0A3E8_9ASPA|nr:hypothetical protein AXF42_Ash021091 [Apostasia shenzhenica]